VAKKRVKKPPVRLVIIQGVCPECGYGAGAGSLFGKQHEAGCKNADVKYKENQIDAGND